MSGEARTQIQPFADQSSPAMDEPIRETVRRDVLLIGSKFAYVCKPSEWTSPDTNRLSEWDLWGPLLMCVLLSVGCWIKSPDDDKKSVFSFIFAFYWIGLFGVVVNASYIGGTVQSYIQGLGVLGYTSFPFVACCIMALLTPDILGVLRVVAVACGAYMSAKASERYVSQIVPEAKFFLGYYPLLLFYAVVGWIVCVV